MSAYLITLKNGNRVLVKDAENFDFKESGNVVFFNDFRNLASFISSECAQIVALSPEQVARESRLGFSTVVGNSERKPLTLTLSYGQLVRPLVDLGKL